MSIGLKVLPCTFGGTLSITAAAAPEPEAVTEPQVEAEPKETENNE